MKSQTLLSLTSFLLIAGCYGTDTKAEVSVVVLSSLQRVLQNEVNIHGANEAEVFCAGGETESFQIIVANRQRQDLPAVDLKASDWTFTGSNPQVVPVLRMFREHYVTISSPSPRSNSKAGRYPDALIPFVNPYTGKKITEAMYQARGQNVKPNSSQGYWIDIEVKRDVAAGTYINQITVSSNGKEIASVPVKVTVWDFELPKVHKLKTYFGKMRDVSGYHSVGKSSIEYGIIENRYRRMLCEHGVNLRFQTNPKINHSTGAVTFTAEFISALRNYTEQFNPSITRVEMFFLREPHKRARYLSDWETFLKKNAWIPEPIIYYPEPSSLKTYKEAIDYGRAVKMYCPSAKYFVVEQIRPEKSHYPSFEGVADIWCPTWWLANVSDIKRRQAAGDQVWSYVHGDNSRITSWLIEFPVLNYRIPAWFSYSLDLKGLHYWQTTSWSRKNGGINPWVNYSTYSKAKFSSGEGFLLYPGKEAGTDGPVASIRLKVLRDGIEDYDYFYLLSSFVGEAEVRNIVGKVAGSFRIYSKESEDYLRARKLIAESILEKQ